MSAYDLFMDKNGLWSECIREVEEKGRANASSIARLIYACEIGDGIDQHASEDLKVVSSQLAALRERVAAYHDEVIALRQASDMVGAADVIIGLNEQIAFLLDRVTKEESELMFYRGLTMGNGDHDKVMLARDGEVFLRCFKLLGMDVSGTDIQEIPDAIERLKGGEHA